MAIKIIRRGEDPKTKPHRASCGTCHTLVEFRSTDDEVSVCGDVLTLDCPVCGDGLSSDKPFVQSAMDHLRDR